MVAPSVGAGAEGSKVAEHAAAEQYTSYFARNLQKGACDSKYSQLLVTACHFLLLCIAAVTAC